jgi:predicted NUDIX family phosphoesterase
VIIIDRSIDYLTPLLRQTVYEGVADEVYGVKAGILKMPSSKFDDGSAKEKKNESAYKLIKLNSEKDYVYEQIKGLSLIGAKAVLKAKSAEFNQFR